jgi:Flp pilus assembly protein TadG
MALALGIVTGGIAYSHKIALNGAAREASRFGATLPEDQCVPASNCSGMTWAQLVRAQAVANSGGSLATTQVCVALVRGPGTAPVAVAAGNTTAGGTSPCFVDNSADTNERVQVSVTKPATIEAVFFTRTINMTSRAVSRYEAS